jgi:hypothetical protein
MLFGESAEEYAEVTHFGGPPTYLRVGPTVEQKREALIALARADYVRGDMTVDAFERYVAEILADRPTSARAAGFVTLNEGRLAEAIDRVAKSWKVA